jgi:hypothetical protein
MDTQGYTNHFDQATGSTSGRGQLALVTFLVGAMLGAAVGWSANRVTAASPAAPIASEAGDALAAPAAAASTASRAQAAAPARRSIVVVIPGERDYVTSTTLAVAGSAYGRPHGPRVRSVQVELYVAGELVDRADLEVFSSRFAGGIELPTLPGRAEAELRISDPTRPSSPIVVRRFTIHAPATMKDAAG